MRKKKKTSNFGQTARKLGSQLSGWVPSFSCSEHVAMYSGLPMPGP